MDSRKIETILARFTLGFVALYFPVETYASWRYGLLNPFYLVDLLAMILLLWGALHSLRASPRSRPEILCAAYGWTAANAWRSATWRIYEVRGGGRLDFGAAEFWIVIVSTILILACFALSLVLTARRTTTDA